MRLSMGDDLLIIIVESHGFITKDWWCFLHTDIAGFTKIMTIATINIHYGWPAYVSGAQLLRNE